jgi:hypothetical protein
MSETCVTTSIPITADTGYRFKVTRTTIAFAGITTFTGRAIPATRTGHDVAHFFTGKFMFLNIHKSELFSFHWFLLFKLTVNGLYFIPGFAGAGPKTL